MAFTPKAHKATKHQVKLKIGIQGPSGSGKTLGALELAKGFVPGGKVLLVDTEHESASLYADKYEFDTIPLPPPFLSTSYESCIDYAVANGYDVLVIDSITHQWDGEGGILRRKEAVDERGGNSFTNWKPFTEEHNKFKEKIIQAPIHIIATMRSKTEYIMEANDKGKQMPKKVGTSPIQRDGMEYEFSLVFDVQMDHRGKASKNRTGLFEGQLVNLCDPKTAETLRQWMSTGTEATAPAQTEPATPDPATAPHPQSAPAQAQRPAYDHAKALERIKDATILAVLENTYKTDYKLAITEEQRTELQKEAGKRKKELTVTDTAKYTIRDDGLIEVDCKIVDMRVTKEVKDEKGKVTNAGCVRVTINAPQGEVPVISCWRTHLFEALATVKKTDIPVAAFLIGKINKEYFNLEDVERIGNQRFRDGKPIEDTPIDDRDIPEFEPKQQELITPIDGVDNEVF